MDLKNIKTAIEIPFTTTLATTTDTTDGQAALNATNWSSQAISD